MKSMQYGFAQLNTLTFNSYSMYVSWNCNFINSKDVFDDKQEVYELQLSALLQPLVSSIQYSSLPKSVYSPSTNSLVSLNVWRLGSNSILNSALPSAVLQSYYQYLAHMVVAQFDPNKALLVQLVNPTLAPFIVDIPTDDESDSAKGLFATADLALADCQAEGNAACVAYPFMNAFAWKTTANDAISCPVPSVNIPIAGYVQGG